MLFMERLYDLSGDEYWKVLQAVLSTEEEKLDGIEERSQMRWC